MGFVLLGDWSQLHCCVCDELDSQGTDSIGDRTSLRIFGDSAGRIRGMDSEATGTVRASAIVSSHVVGGANASDYVACAPVDGSQKDLHQDLALYSSSTTWAVELRRTTLRRRDFCDLVARRSAGVISAT